MRLGLIARADTSGLGNQTYEFFQHMKPDATLVVDMGAAARGPQCFAWYPGCEVTAYNPATYQIEDRGALRRLCSAVDVVYTAEVPYSPDLLAIASETDTKVVLHANPELLQEDMLGAEIWLPTAWQRALVEQRTGREVRVVPFPVPVSPPFNGEPYRYPFVSTLRLVHVAAPAMLDRNGSEIVAEAIALMHCPTEWTIYGVIGNTAGDPLVGTFQRGNATVEHRAPEVNYWDLYRPHDILVLPRRYGGLSLPMQEAASVGLGIVSLDLEPQRDWLHPAGLVPARGAQWAMMKGGQFMVHDCDPARLAAALDALVLDPSVVKDMRAHARAWAESLSWDEWAPKYREWLAA